MIKEEIWSISIQRARAFFREQTDVTEEGLNDYSFGTCRIHLTELKPKGMGVWPPSGSRSAWRVRKPTSKPSITAILSNSFPPEVNI